jgi:hypothetical protein
LQAYIAFGEASIKGAINGAEAVAEGLAGAVAA